MSTNLKYFKVRTFEIYFKRHARSQQNNSELNKKVNLSLNKVYYLSISY